MSTPRSSPDSQQTQAFSTVSADDAELLADINSNPKIKRDFLALIAQKGYPSVSEYMLTVLRTNAAERRRAKIEALGKQMFPNGVQQNDTPPGG